MNAKDQARLNIVNARITGISGGTHEDAEFEDIDALEGEAKELRDAIAKRNRRVSEIQEKR